MQHDSILPTTDREIMFSLSNKIDVTNSNMERLCMTIEGVVKSLEKLETTRIKDHEDRINKIELWISEWEGVYKFVGIIALGLSIVGVLISLVN